MNSEYRSSLALLLVLSLFILATGGVLVVLYYHETDAGLLTSTELKALKKQLETAPKDDALQERIRQEDLRLRREHVRDRARFRGGAYLLVAAAVAWVAAARRHFGVCRRGMTSCNTLEQDIHSLEAELAKLRAWTAAEKRPAPVPEEEKPPAGEGPEGAIAALESRLSEMRAKIAEMEAEMAHLAFHARERGRQPAAEVRRQAFWVIGIVGGLLLALLAGLGFFAVPVLPPEEYAKPVGTAKTPAPGPGTPAPETPAPETPLEPAPVPIAEAAPDEVWPFFRGPNAGVAAAGDWPTTWSVAENRNVVWETEIPVSGKSSPIVWGGKIFLTGGDKKNHHVVCVDRETGDILWNSRLDLEIPEEMEVFEDTGYAASTPATDGRRVYAIFPSGHLAAFDFNGKQLWAIRLGLPKSSYGYASSLAMAEDVLIVQYDQGMDAEDNLSQLIGINPATGEFLYRQPRPVGNSWASPTLIRPPSGPQVVTCAPEWVLAHDPFTGKELWRAAFKGQDIAVSPAFGGGLVFATNDGIELLAIRPDGSGDVTATRVAWRADEGLPDTCSPVCDDKYVFLSAAGGLLTCYNAQTGEQVWKHYVPESASASFILAGGLAYLPCEDGATLILKPGDQYEQAGRGEVGEKVYATPAFVTGRIYIRGGEHLFCIGE